ncbi:hypothetical protein JMM81_19685 [Bacillus sp. V3B]|uniref:zinc ribbon domain-containing protein n=1 Tax=Bacillus sp. V3B TaxID=2804915 RepID=UPI00210D35F1|nr:hypothetical protein [Bacillus sp. V3B]MCQ6277100.1 hypothetical protein [Bacillus sp. V3B]
MKFCKNCGVERREGQIFCNSCGNKFDESMFQETASVHHRSSVQPNTEQRYQEPRKPMSKKNQVILISIAIVAALGFGGHKFLESMYSPQKTVEKFEAVVEEQDVEKAKEVIAFSDFPEEVEDKEIKNYLAFLKGNQAEVVAGLKDSASAYEKDTLSVSLVVDRNDNEMVKLVQADKKLGLYQEYKIEAVPFEVKVDSNLERVEIDFMGKKEKLKDRLTLTPVLPGTYELKGSFNGEYAKLTETTELDFLNADGNTLDVFLEFEGQYVDIYSNEENSTLFVNGESTGMKVGDFIELGPLPMDGSIVLHAEYQAENGVIKTNEVKVMNTDDVYLEFKEEELVSPEEDSTVGKASLEQFIILGEKTPTSIL